jgi:hypothetical protein
MRILRVAKVRCKGQNSRFAFPFVKNRLRITISLVLSAQRNRTPPDDNEVFRLALWAFVRRAVRDRKDNHEDANRRR